MAELRGRPEDDGFPGKNRVFAVLTPQVFEVIEPDSVARKAATLQFGVEAAVA